MRLQSKRAAKQPDVFISYSPQNSLWVEKTLIPTLNARGIHCCTEKDFPPGTVRLTQIEQAVKRCRKTVLVLSESWRAGEWTNQVSFVVQTQDPAAIDRRLLPLLYQACEIPARLAMLTTVDCTKPRKRRQELERLAAAILGEDS